MPYDKTTWQNSPSQETPIDANSLNKIENGLAFAINQYSANATFNTDWQASGAIGAEFKKVGNLIVSHFGASITNVDGMHLFIGSVPENMRPSVATAFPAVFVPSNTTDYEARIIVINVDGTIQIAKNPTVTGSFYCSMVYFVDQPQVVYN